MAFSGAYTRQKLYDVVAEKLRKKEDINKLKYVMVRYGYDESDVTDAIDTMNRLAGGETSIEGTTGISTSGMSETAKAIAEGRLTYDAFTKKATPTETGAVREQLLKAGYDITQGKEVNTGDPQKDSQLKGAISMLKQIGDLSLKLNTDEGMKARAMGPIESVQSAIGANIVPGTSDYEDVTIYKKMVKNVSLIVRAMGEVGNLSTGDVDRIINSLPTLGNTPKETRGALNMLAGIMNDVAGSEVLTFPDEKSELKTEKEQNDPQQARMQQLYNQAIANPDNPNSQLALDKLKEAGFQPPTTSPAPDNTQKTPVSKPEGALGGFIGDVGERAGNIAGNFAETKDQSFFERVLRAPEMQLRQMGEVAGLAVDAGVRALQGVYNVVTPDSTKEKIKSTAEEFLQTDGGQQALSALQAGAQEWDNFRNKFPNAAKDLSAVGNILMAFPSAGGLGLAGKETKALSKDLTELTIQTVGKDAVKKSSDDVFKAVKPYLSVSRDKAAIRPKMDLVNSELLSRGVQPKSLAEYVEGITVTKKQIWNEVEAAVGEGENLKINLRSIANKLAKEAQSPVLARADTNAANKLQKMADRLLSQGDTISVPEAESLKQYLNAELQGAFGKFNLSKAEQNAKKMMTSEIGKQLDATLSNVPGQFQSLKNRYGALAEIGEDAAKRLIVFERQNPQSLVDSFSKISGIGKIVGGIGTASPLSIAEGATQLAIGKIQKAANNADLLIKKSFERLAKRSGEFEPRSMLLKKLKGHPAGMSAVEDFTNFTPEIEKTIKKVGFQNGADDFGTQLLFEDPKLFKKLGLDLYEGAGKEKLNKFYKATQEYWNKKGGGKLDFNSAGPASSAKPLQEGGLLAEAKKYKSADEFVKKQPVVYHGSPTPLKKFSNKKGGVFFTDSMEDAGGFGSPDNVYEGYLNFKKPLVIDAKGAKWDKLNTKYGTSTQEVISNAQKDGYDGVTFKNIVDNVGDTADWGGTSTIHYAYKPEDSFLNESQIKDIWNKANLQEGGKKKLNKKRK